MSGEHRLRCFSRLLRYVMVSLGHKCWVLFHHGEDAVAQSAPSEKEDHGGRNECDVFHVAATKQGSCRS